ncbi:MAG: hypothetical protein KatS3mg053_1904 [Candidatus Roseilinea sp.]|nr:MAG: hypothetical protein KatS3mg053_1904 [Candidatus Roseilinea sp.]
MRNIVVMSRPRYEYKVAFVDFRGRVSIEGEETLIQDGERMTAFGRRYLNALGEQGWELVGVQPQPAGGAFHIFKRPLAEGEQAEPAKPIEQPEPRWGTPPPPPHVHPFPPPAPFVEEWVEEGPPPSGRSRPPPDRLLRWIRRHPNGSIEEWDDPAP